MTARALVSGVIFKAPVEKTSKAGNAYVTTTIRDGKVTPPDGGKPSFSATMRWRKSFGLAMATRSRSPASSIARPTKPMPARTA